MTKLERYQQIVNDLDKKTKQLNIITDRIKQLKATKELIIKGIFVSNDWDIIIGGIKTIGVFNNLTDINNMIRFFEGMRKERQKQVDALNKKLK